MPGHLGAVTQRIDTFGTGFKEAIGLDAPGGFQARRCRQLRARTHAHCREHRIGVNKVAIVQGHAIAGLGAVDLGGQWPEMESGTLGFQRPLYRTPRGLRQQGGQTPAHGIDGLDRKAPVQQVVGELATDQTGANYSNLLGTALLQRIPEPAIVIQVVDPHHLVGGVTAHGGTNQFGAQCQNQLGVSQGFAVAQLQGFAVGVDGGHVGAGAQRHVELFGHGLRGLGCQLFR